MTPRDGGWMPTNRQKSKSVTKKCFFWCRCDRNLIGKHGKCLVCGHVANKKKIRDSLHEDDE